MTLCFLTGEYHRFVVAFCYHFQDQTSSLEMSEYVLFRLNLGGPVNFRSTRCHKSEVRKMNIFRIE